MPGNQSKLSVFQPFASPSLRRYGRNSDGGYVVPENTLNDSETLLSLGLGYDISFENEVKKRHNNIRFVGFDHTSPYSVLTLIRYIINSSLKCEFNWAKQLVQFMIMSKHVFPSQHIRKKVVQKPKETIEISLEEVLDHVSNRTFMKMDIEGSEYQILAKIAENSNLFTGFVIEFHDVHNQFKSIQEFLDSIPDFKIVHLHANNLSGFGLDGFPNVIELTVVRKEYAVDQRIYEIPRAGLDFPNSSEIAEISISWLGA